MRNFLIILFLFFSLNLFPKGVIIGFDSTVISIFKNSNEHDIQNIASGISLKYDRVIIHLGRKYPFTKSFFADNNAKKNLQLFCRILKQNDIKIYMWILDSFGSDNFLKIHQEHKEIIDDATARLSEFDIYYDGIVVDMEWINYPQGNNNDKYIEILKYIRDKIGNKQLFAFAPLIDNKKVNSKRGYDINKIKKYADNLIAMLYVVNSDLCNCNHIGLQPCMNDNRIADLRKYFKRKNLLTAISLNQGIIVRNDDGDYEFSLPVKNESHSLFNNLKLSEKRDFKFYEVRLYYPMMNFNFLDENGNLRSVKSNEYVYYIRLKQNILNNNDFLWEYSLADSFD